MRKYIYSTIVLIFFLLASSASAQSLWHGTKYGMSIEQVKSVVPNAIRPLNPDDRPNGYKELLRLGNVILVNEHFVASFLFKTGKLKQVTLSLEKKCTFHSAMLVFDSLTEALRAKYGPEINRQIQNKFLNKAEATWLSGRTNISLVAVSVGENDAFLDIYYQVRVSAEADNL